MNFSSQNGVIWCILGVLFLRFMCPIDCSCMINFIYIQLYSPECTLADNIDMINFIEVLLKGKNKTLVRILGGRQHRTTLLVKYWGSRPLQPLRR